MRLGDASIGVYLSMLEGAVVAALGAAAFPRAGTSACTSPACPTPMPASSAMRVVPKLRAWASTAQVQAALYGRLTGEAGRGRVDDPTRPCPAARGSWVALRRRGRGSGPARGGRRASPACVVLTRSGPTPIQRIRSRSSRRRWVGDPDLTQDLVVALFRPRSVRAGRARSDLGRAVRDASHRLFRTRCLSSSGAPPVKRVGCPIRLKCSMGVGLRRSPGYHPHPVRMGRFRVRSAVSFSPQVKAREFPPRLCIPLRYATCALVHDIRLAFALQGVAIMDGQDSA